CIAKTVFRQYVLRHYIFHNGVRETIYCICLLYMLELFARCFCFKSCFPCRDEIPTRHQALFDRYAISEVCFKITSHGMLHVVCTCSLVWNNEAIIVSTIRMLEVGVKWSGISNLQNWAVPKRTVSIDRRWVLY